MPFLIPLGVGVLVAANVITGWTAFFALTAASLLSGWLEMQMMDQPSDMGTKVGTRTTSQQIQVIYGREMVSGNDAVIDTFSTGSSTPNDELMAVQAMCEGPCHGIALAKETWNPRRTYTVDDIVEHEGSIYIAILGGKNQEPPNATYWAVDSGTYQVYLDDIHYSEYQAISDWFCTWEFINGTFTQVYSDYTMLTDLYNRTSGRTYPYDDNYRGTCCLVWHLGWDNEGRVFHGLPTRTALIKGRTLYDFRDSSTAWSDNPVLALYDYMTDTRYGLGISSSKLDAGVSGTWTDAANYCDTKYWKINVAIRQKNAWDVIGTILKLFRGQLVWYDDIFYLHYADTTDEAETGITIDDDYIVRDDKGKALISISQPSRFTKPDALRGAFLNPRKQWTLDHVVVGESLGKIDNFELIGCNDQFHVTDLSVYALERMQLNRTISGVFRDDLIVLEPHDLIRLNSTTYGLTNELMRVVQSDIRPDGPINLQLQYEDDALYNDNYDIDVNDVYECVIPDPLSAIAPSSLNVVISTDTMGSDIPIIIATLTWTSTGNRQTKYYLIQWRTTETLWATSTGYSVGNVRKNDNEYYICISNHTSSASDEPGTGANWETYWELSPWPNKARIDATLTTTMTHRIPGIYNDTWDFRVRSVNYNGVASTWVLHQEVVADGESISAYLPSDARLIGYWDFEEGTGTIVYDKSGNANNGTFEGTSNPWFSTGVSGRGVKSYGLNSERIDCGNSAPLDDIGDSVVATYKDITFLFWISTVDSSPLNYGNVLSKYYDTNNRFDIGSNGTTNQLRIAIYKGGVGGVNVFDDITPFDGAGWHLIAIVVDYSNRIIRAYMDAVESSETFDISSMSSGWDNAGNLSFLARNDGSLPYEGLLDEVRIYSRVLTQQEIRALYRIPSGNQSIAYGGGRLDSPYLTVGPHTERGEFSSIQDAINALSVTGHRGIIIKDKGSNYVISTAITMPDYDIDIIAESKNVVIENTSDTNDIFHIDTKSKNYLFSGLGFKMNGSTTSKSAIHIETCTSACGVTVKDCYFNLPSAYQRGIQVTGASSNQLSVRNCTFSAGAYGIYCSDGFYLHAVGNVFDGCYYGVYFIRSSQGDGNVRVNGNDFIDLLVHNVIVEDISNIEVANNSVLVNSGTGLVGNAGTYTALGINSGYGTSVMSNNKVTIRSYGSVSSSINGIAVVDDVSGTCKVSITGNTVEIVISGAIITRGYNIAYCKKAAVTGNVAHVDNDNTSSNHYGYRLLGNAYMSFLDNTADLVNSLSSTYDDYGYDINDCDYSTIIGNTQQNTGISYNITNTTGHIYDHNI